MRRDFDGSDGGSSSALDAEVNPRIADESVRACDVLLTGIEEANVTFDSGVIGHWSRRGSEFAISFVARDDRAPIAPFTWRGAFKEKSAACYDRSGAKLGEGAFVWP